MKKVKFYKKSNEKRRKITNSKNILIKVCLYLTISILIAIIIIFIIFQFRGNKIKEPETISPDEIMYKGSKILKTQLLTDYFSRISISKINRDDEKYLLNYFLNLSEYSNKPNEKDKIKNLFLNYFSEIKKKRMNKVETIFADDTANFGNSLIDINNIIFYCEVVGCHTIILNTTYSLIKHPLYIKKLNIKIIPGSEVNCADESTICYVKFYHPQFIRPQIRMQYLREEIIRNIPKVNIDSKALYINIRGGDIFSSYIHPSYSQPPLCFYEKIINNNKFKNIYIISKDRQNPVLNALTDKYNNIIFRLNNYETDIASLVHAYYVVAPVSSFFFSAIKLNDNLKILWEYDIYRLKEKFRWLHHDLYKFDIKYKIYTMKPSDIYADQMYYWRNTQSQLKLMIEDKCPYDFVLTKTN